MNDQLYLENYSPFEVEKKWQEKWENLKAFSPNPEDDGEPFCVVIPPPNVTAVSYTHLTLPTTVDV